MIWKDYSDVVSMLRPLAVVLVAVAGWNVEEMMGLNHLTAPYAFGGV
jgi:hypothetical protein